MVPASLNVGPRLHCIQIANNRNDVVSNFHAMPRPTSNTMVDRFEQGTRDHYALFLLRSIKKNIYNLIDCCERVFGISAIIM